MLPECASESWPTVGTALSLFGGSGVCLSVSLDPFLVILVFHTADSLPCVFLVYISV